MDYIALEGGTAGAGTEEGLRCVDVRYSLGKTAVLDGTDVAWLGASAHGILGPSGAGKTTLLRCVIGDVGGQLTGRIEVGGGRAVGKGERRAMSALVPQDDVMPFALSAREILRFAAKLRGLPARSVDALIKDLSLERCESRPVGDPSMGERGASGGERKRISIGMELLSSPRWLCADEPTSGLDSTAALDVVRLLKRHVGATSDVCLVTLHQPSWTLLATLDSVTFLANQGRVAYSGPTEPLVQWFADLGYATPPHENAADVAMRALQDQPKDGANRLVDAWNNDNHHRAVKNNAAAEATTPHHREEEKEEFPPQGGAKRPSSSVAVPAVVQIWCIAARTARELLTDRTKLMGVFGSKLVVGVVVGLVWFGLCKHTTNEAIYATTSALFIAVFNNCMETLFTTLLHVPATKALLHREYQNSLYSFQAWFVATFAVLFVQQWVAAFLLSAPLYWMAGLRRDPTAFALFMACQGLLSCVGAALGLAIGGFSQDFASARQKIIPTLMPLIIFAGYLVPYDQLHAYDSWIYWASLFQYGLTIVKVIQWRGVTFTDCAPIAHDFGLCFLTGDEFLLSTHSDPDALARSFAYLAALLVAFVALSFAVLRAVATKPAN